MSLTIDLNDDRTTFEPTAGLTGTAAWNLAQPPRAVGLRLPESPYSFSGKLISLVWALELVAEPSKEVIRREFVLAPGGEEVRLDSLPARETTKRLFTRIAR